MRSLFVKFVKNAAGITSIEYGLIATLVAIAILGAVTTLGTKLSTLFSKFAASV